jgi:uncharacterized membrane protein
MTAIDTIISFIKKHAYKLLWAGIILYCGVITIICICKYQHFGYNALDLGIYNQVFYNTSFGRFFQFTIHPHSYLGDHFEIFLLLLTPFYILWRSPVMLLLLQTVFLALSAWPLFLIAKGKLGKPGALFISLVFLCCPLVQNSNLFEFHILPFVIFFLLWAYYFYKNNRFVWWLVFSIICLTIREDVSLIIIMFSALAFVEKKSWRWKVTPALIGGLWFLTTLKIISSLNHYGQYKFFYYYQWLGDSWSAAFTTIITKPYILLQRLFAFDNILLLLVLIFMFAALPLRKPKLLLLGIFPLAQLLFASFAKMPVLETHYASVLVVPLFLASIDSLAVLKPSRQQIFCLILAVITLYSMFTLGPLSGAIKLWQKNQTTQDATELKKSFIELVPSQASVVTTYDLLTTLSGRPAIYSLHYVFKGTKQYSSEPYILPDTVQYALIDFNDFLTYHAQYSTSDFYASGDGRVRNLLENNFGLVKITDTLSLWKKGAPSFQALFTINPQEPIENEQINKLSDQINFLGFSTPRINSGQTIATLDISLYWQAAKQIEKDYQLEIELLGKDGESLHKQLYPLAYGLHQTNKWKTNEIVKTNQWLYVPRNKLNSLNEIKISLIDIKGYLGLDALKSAVVQISDKKVIGDPIIIQL